MTQSTSQKPGLRWSRVGTWVGKAVSTTSSSVPWTSTAIALKLCPSDLDQTQYPVSDLHRTQSYSSFGSQKKSTFRYDEVNNHRSLGSHKVRRSIRSMGVVDRRNSHSPNHVSTSQIFTFPSGFSSHCSVDNPTRSAICRINVTWSVGFLNVFLPPALIQVWQI